MEPRREVLADGVEIWLGDMLEVLPMLPEFDACVTDPPYGIGFAAQPTMYQRTHGFQPQSWDDEPATEKHIKALLAWSKFAIVWGGNYFPLPPTRCWLAWTKPDSPPSMADMELAWTNMDKNSKRLEKSVKSAALEKGFAVGLAHPTQKPVPLMTWCIDQLSADVGTILDPFMGSGTTGVAAIKRGKAFTGIEREPKYFDIARRRLTEALNAPDMFVERPAPPKQEAMFTED
jgi:site-specific DNA-methyltransferase (adenine-specific)